MNLSSYVDQLRRELAVAAEAGGEDARALAERLTAPLDAATRLTLLEALSAAAEEITRDLAPGSVEVRLRGRDAEFVVTPPPSEPAREEPPPPGSLRSALAGALEVTMGVRPPYTPEAEEGGGTSRITLRLPEHLKPRIEEAAARMGLSVNAWLVRAVSAALEPGEPGPAPGRHPGPGGDQRLGRGFTGWVR
ncbi:MULTISPECIES: toxin-antitoxin system HicB family antitoxin [Actinomadura]|uniref:Toxin-antitoxin system HicB family antitoxin n=1 Tax=Actinomadura yumaensis TaxID=111807 RepID=A0ABW2CCI7_9ACTN|nr:toxin-antitoxin system HicB family antitoxin [Actinomadura sp. J1-007]MWK38154.1 toxin-antitoxin system HicB family antitoxin [Actinomadura sp. J1-007]